MKKVLVLLFSLVACFISATGEYDIIPKPMSITPVDAVITVDKSINVYVDDALDKGYITELFKEMHLALTFAKSPKNAFLSLAIDKNNRYDNDGYRLEITHKGKTRINAKANTKSGLLNAMQSLRQLATISSDGTVTIPCCIIEDAPSFPWRAFMLDESRHFQGMNAVKQLLDEMAYLKMNVFHWHLVDDPGWRIEIKKYPLLTSIGSKRDFSHREITPEGWDSIYSERAYYTQDEIREIVRYADARGISVIPEVEMPGHASASIAAYPWLGSSSRKDGKPVWGDLYQVADAKVMGFLEDVMDEVISLFPSKIVHIGGDEAGFVHWQNSDEVNAYMNANNIPTCSDLQLWAINKMSAYLASKGCRMIGWNEITGDNIRNEAHVEASQAFKLADGSIVQFWDGEVSLVNKAIEKGYDVVNSNRFFTYLDYSYEATPLDKAYSFNPIPEGLSEKDRSKILGLGCQMWGEFTPDIKRVYYQTFPRIAAFAESGWTGGENKNYDEFCRRVQKTEHRWRKMGYLGQQPSY